MRTTLLLLSLLCCAAGHAAGPRPPGHAVASAHPLATEAGLAVLRDGGNAFDAAVAVSAALGVVEPFSSGFGGGGFWLLHREKDGLQVMIDGRETAPAAAHARMYLDTEGEFVRAASINGPLAAGIPGLPAALAHLSERYGALPLRRTLAAAIRHAEQGFAVTERYRRMAKYRRQVLRSYPAAAAIFLHNGQAPKVGHRIKQPALARTIREIAEQGRDGFYEGRVAGLLVQGARAYGGIWTLDDLDAYKVLERKPLVFRYRDIRVVSAPPPSSGGVALAQALEILSAFRLDDLTGVERKHYIVEAMRRAYRDRALFLGDPDFVDVPVRRLLDRDYLAGLALSIDSGRATPSARIGDTPGLPRGGAETTHFSVMDSAGNRVAATLSVNLPFGSGFVAAGAGVLFNNEMDDFSAKPAAANAYELVGAEANMIAPGKRPLSSMSPTFMETERAVGILGTPGGGRIISMVLLGILDFADGNPPRSWVSLRRFHHQYLPDTLSYEKYGLSAYEARSLRALGHKLEERKRRYGNMQAIMWDKENGILHAASDPRGEGEARVETR